MNSVCSYVALLLPCFIVLTGCGSSGPSASKSTLLRGLVALWSAEDNARDSADGHDGQMLFGADFGPGKVGRGFHFATDRGRVHIPDAKDFLIEGSFTVAGWVQVAEFPPEGAGGCICMRGDNRGGLDTWSIATISKERVSFSVSSEANQSTSVVALAKPEQQWFHLACVYDQEGRRLALYLDGRLAAEKNDPVEPIWRLDDSQEPGIGLGNVQGTFHIFPFRGSLDEWVLFARALPESDIRGLVRLGKSGKRIVPAADSR